MINYNEKNLEKTEKATLKTYNLCTSERILTNKSDSESQEADLKLFQQWLRLKTPASGRSSLIKFNDKNLKKTDNETLKTHTF